MLFIVTSILCYDIWFYISHILLHNKKLYKYHREHHTKINPIFLDTYKGHFLEGPFQSLGVIIPLTLLNYTMFDFAIVMFLLNARGMMRHDDRFSFLIGNHHLLHHKYPNYNFGEYWLDSFCGTRIPTNSEYKYGLLYT